MFNFKIANSKVFIKAKVNNQIITNIDVKNEKNYLLALNPSLRNLSEENINRYAIDSLINEKVKKIGRVIETFKSLKKFISSNIFKINAKDKKIKNVFSKVIVNTLLK